RYTRTSVLPRESALPAFRISARVTAFCLASAIPCFAQVQSVVVGKDIQYQQTSATNVQTTPVAPGQTSDLPYGFSADVNGVNIGSIAIPVVTGPFDAARLAGFYNNGRLFYSAGDRGWRMGPNADDWSSPTP